MTSAVPYAGQSSSTLDDPYNVLASSTTASGVIGGATQTTKPSSNPELSASTYLETTTFIDDQSFIASCNRGPITTAFVHPASCTDTLRNEEDTLASPFYFGHWNFRYDLPCFPIGTIPAASLPGANWGSYYYSPAICPYGWTTVTQFTSWVPQYGPLSFTLRPETSAALCCPSGYKYGDDGHVCSSTITHGQAFTFVQYTTDGVNLLPGPTVATKALANIPVWGDGVPIWWQSSDAEVLAKAAAMTSTIRPTSTEPTPTPTKPATPTQTSPSEGLSTVTKIGIGVGASLAAITILALGVFLWKMRRRRKNPDIGNDSDASNGGGEEGGSMGHKETVDVVKDMHNGAEEIREHGAEQLHELPEASHTPPELQDLPETYHNRHELSENYVK